MKNKPGIISLAVILAFGCFLAALFSFSQSFENKVQAEILSINSDDTFNQDEALARLREAIKGKEKEPAENVFKNIQILKGRSAAQVLGIMQMGFSRSLGVTCTHCHTPEDWSSEDKNKKQVAREMWAMQANINSQMLKNIKNISERAMINCSTCHRGQTIPALNLPTSSPAPTASPKG